MTMLRSVSLAAVLIAATGSAGLRVHAAEPSGTYAVDAAASKIYWVGKKVTGQHNGTVDVANGTFQVKSGRLTGGTIVLQMDSIKNEDLKDAETNQKLTGHLKSPDFFDVANHPEATFEITSVKPVVKAKAGEPNADVSGELTIKGISNPLSFPARVDLTGDTLTATAKDIAVDRTLYNVRYGSGKFFQNLGDKVISDDFWIDLKLVATKQ